MRKIIKSACVIMAVLCVFLCDSMVFASNSKSVNVKATDSSILFENIEYMKDNQIVEYQIIGSDGNLATVGIEKISTNPSNALGLLKAGSSTNTVKVWYTGATINAHFYMDVKNNKVTRVYDDWILVIGGTYDNESLTKTSSYGKLTFRVNAYGGVMSAKCWLKGTVTGSGNNVSVTWQM